MLKVPLEMPAPAAVPSVQIIRAVLREYHTATHTAEVEPVMGPASLVGEIPVLMSCRPDLLTTGREVAVLTWSDVGGLVLAPYGAVPDDPPSADNADTVDDIHAATTPTANKLLAMNANAKFPTHTIEGSLTVETGFNVGTTGAASGYGYFQNDVRAGRGIYAGRTGTDPGDNNIVADGMIYAKGLLKGRAASSADVFGVLVATPDCAQTTNPKITCTWSGSSGNAGAGGAFLICMGYRSTTAAHMNYGVGIFSCVKRYNNIWYWNFTQITTLGTYGAITATQVTNTSTAFEMDFAQASPSGHAGGGCNVVQIGITRYPLTWTIGEA